METRRRDARTGLVRTASTETGLADVVRSARKLSGKPLVWQVDCKVAARLARCEPIAREESFPARPATLPSRNVLSLSFHDVARTARDRRVVETRATSGIFAHGFSGSGASALKLARWRIYSPAMAKEGLIVTEGTVTQVLPGTMFRIDLPGQRNVLAHIAGTMRKHFIRIVPAICASTLRWPGRSMRNIVPGNTCVTVPSVTISPSLAMAGEYILQRASFKADAPDPLKPWANIPEVALVSTTRRSRAVRATS